MKLNGRPFSPAVRLSPNARNLVVESRRWLRATTNEQLAVRACVSVAVQLTVVVPSWKVDPDAGEQETFTGAAPPVTDGAGYVTSCESPLISSCTVDAQVI
jgi:hypothetical protein